MPNILPGWGDRFFRVTIAAHEVLALEVLPQRWHEFKAINVRALLDTNDYKGVAYVFWIKTIWKAVST